MGKSSVDKSRSRYGEYVTLRFHKPTKLYELTWNHKNPQLIARFTETDGSYALQLWETLEKLYSEKEDLEFGLRTEMAHHRITEKDLKETLAFRSNQLALMEKLVDDLGSEEMARQMEEILND